MRSITEFIVVALVVTLTPGPATATIIRVAARDGRHAALSATVGNGAGVLVWACLSALGVSSLILASEIAYDVLRFGGAGVLLVLGVRSLLRPGGRDASAAPLNCGRAGWRSGLATGLANPKLAVFFVALFPQFLRPGSDVLPAALAMAAIIVLFDLLWFSTVAYAVDRARTLLRPRLQRATERLTGVILIGLGVRVAREAR